MYVCMCICVYVNMFVCIYAGERQDAAKFVWGGRVEMVKQLLMASRLSECQ